MSADSGHAPAEDRARKAELLLLRVALRLDVVPVSGPHSPEFVARRVAGWVERSGL